jgi:flagellar protein FlgJ
MTIASSLVTPASYSMPVASLPTAGSTADSSSPQADDKTAASAKQFEAVFLSEMMSHMFEGVKTDSEFGGGQGEDMFKSLLTNEYGKQMANKGGIGIADQLQKAMIQMQQHKG